MIFEKAFQLSLFESEERRTDRLLQEALLTILANVTAASECDAAWEKANERTHSAWLVGGWSAARGCLHHSSELRRTWGKGDAGKALALIEVFAFPMISRWYRLADRALCPPSERRVGAREAAASNVMDLFGGSSPERVEDFIKMDRQFNYDRDELERGHTTFVESALILGVAIEECGGPTVVDWGTLVFPVRNLTELAMNGTQFPPFCADVFQLTAVALALNAAERTMVYYYKTASAA